jgi:hypothetical protein
VDCWLEDWDEIDEEREDEWSETIDPGLLRADAVDGDAIPLMTDWPEVDARDERRLNLPGAPVSPRDEGGISMQKRALATLLAMFIAEHIARGLVDCRSISFATLAAGVGQNDDIGDGVGSLNPIGADGGCMLRRGSATSGDAITDAGEAQGQPENSTGVTGDADLVFQSTDLKVVGGEVAAFEG